MDLLFLSASEWVSALFLVAFFVGVPLGIFLLVPRLNRGRSAPDWRTQVTTRAMAEGNAPEILDEAFDGRSTVVYDTRPSDAVSAATAKAGATERHYSLLQDDDGVLTFQLEPQPQR